jgi:hypothetical protein
MDESLPHYRDDHGEDDPMLIQNAESTSLRSVHGPESKRNAQEY